MLLDLDAIRNGIIHDYPYRWILFNNVIRESAKSELVSTSPPEYQFQYGEKDGYGHWVGPPFRKDRVFPQGTAWQKLIEELHSPAYKIALEELTGLDLSEHLLGMLLYQYDPGHGTYPHRDNLGCTIVHMFYFSEKWDSRWGGCFRILKNSHPDSAFIDVPPLFETSVAFINSDKAWHMVPHIAPNITQVRYALKASFYKPQK